MSTDFIALLRRIAGQSSQIAHVEHLPPRPARYAEIPADLSPVVRAALGARGITELYSHQEAAIDAARAGEHIGVVTATASGKTLCYQIPIVEALLADPDARALCLFPTKALAGDQLRSFRALLEALGEPGEPADPRYGQPRWSFVRGPALSVATLDGDTPRPDRDRVRATTRIILSNPDMLHRTLLPDHRRWATLLAGLRYVVLDEAHIYRGVFGSHVALILRRLRRLCAHYGSAPQFICCSATSANPGEHLQALIGDPATLIAEDGAPQGTRSFVLWNPPVIESRRRSESGTRRSTNVETAQVVAGLLRAGVKTLSFARTRRGAELILRYIRESIEATGGSRWAPDGAAGMIGPQAIAAYRAGYTAAERRRLEQAFLEGELQGLVSTNALELGVDIGGVDAVVMSGFPGTVASAWQQAGRAGRAQGHSVAVMVAQDDPLDQFYMRHPAQFFSRSVEHARVALDNPYILSAQLRCAAFELPLREADEHWFGSTYAGLRDWMLRHGDLAALDDGSATAAGRHPAAQVNIRSADGDPIELRDAERGHVIEQLSATRAPFEVYPGAIYLHQGDSYLVERLGERVAEARRAQVNYYTQTREETSIRIERVREQRRVGPQGAIELSLGVVEVTRQVTGYRRKEHYSETLLSEHDLTLPPQVFRTIAVWWTVPEALCRAVEEHCDELVDALHAMEHAAIGLLPLFAQCDRADIGGLSIDMHAGTGMPTIFVYDGVPGGVGIAQVGFEQAEQWWAQTRSLLLECSCIDGCPSCIQSPKCGNGNQHLSRRGAAALASLLTGEPIPSRDLSARIAQAETGAGLLADLRGRLDRARSEPRGPRRAALLAALRYRIRVEREAIQGPEREALAQIEAEAAAL
jgi:DEAD/DEAH box helicase domain-containing protein